jgi:hypothetical protein
MRRRTAPKVIGGRAQRKNNWALTPSGYWGLPHISIERERPGPGHRHLLNKRDIVQFVELVPEWDSLSEGLDAIVLARAESGTDGWTTPGVVGVCAWDRRLWQWTNGDFYVEHREVFDRLGLEVERVRDGWGGYLLKWTESQARAYQLLHVLLHELGHHHDRITNRSRRNLARGESYAEKYALQHEARVWDSYLRKFGLD